ncbi:hypothetical protein NIES2107_10420 [Nostoc carneum NIES-2107]|nr:hypothetical protein NIES2107_10420 [Nostoc carneum NIES-2107]
MHSPIDLGRKHQNPNFIGNFIYNIENKYRGLDICLNKFTIINLFRLNRPTIFLSGGVSFSHAFRINTHYEPRRQINDRTPI